MLCFVRFGEASSISLQQGMIKQVPGSNWNVNEERKLVSLYFAVSYIRFYPKINRVYTMKYNLVNFPVHNIDSALLPAFYTTFSHATLKVLSVYWDSMSPGVRYHSVLSGVCAVWHYFIVLLAASTRESHDELQMFLLCYSDTIYPPLWSGMWDWFPRICSDLTLKNCNLSPCKVFLEQMMKYSVIKLAIESRWESEHVSFRSDIYISLGWAL